MFRILESQAPAKQNATDTINTLSSRLQSATLLEDRRAAILGLRSFAKLYPASVASGALRSLISSLNKDSEDVDTAKVVLETLLILFNPNVSSPEASDDIALWLADEFTQRQENITVLLDLLDKQDFYSRLYSLQLISAISTARPERTQECVFTAPLGVSRLVAILDDRREAIRNEGLVLLMALTPSYPDLQKLVAFENAFDRIFSIIDAEGSLTQGGILVQDCLSLLANLLCLNVSNQSYFRETGWVVKLAKMLKEVLLEQDSSDGVAEWAKIQRDKNVWGLLSVIRLFLVKGSVGAQASQISFWQAGLVDHVLGVAFHTSIASAIRAEALTTCSDLIRGNNGLQEEFAQLSVCLTTDISSFPKTNGHIQTHALPKTNVIQALLDLALSVPAPHSFDLRLSACECIKSYLYNHGLIRLHFLRRAREGYLSGQNEMDNILTILIKNGGSIRVADPYHQWIAAVILFHILYEDYETKTLARSIAEGDAAMGEEVVTCIQALSGKLMASALKGDDKRVAIGYLMVLIGWLFEDPDAVNDFLGEGINVQGLIQLVLRTSEPSILVGGLSAFLLGIVYEFSTKDSPIPRMTLHQILTDGLGRELFVDKMTKLREHQVVRDFEVLPQGTASDQASSLPEVYFDKTFLDFLKDSFSRVIRAIDRDPSMEVAVIANGVQKGVSRELVDMLKAQLEDRNQALQMVESDRLTLERKLNQEQADLCKAKEFATIELGRIKGIHEALQRNHEEHLTKLKGEHRRALTSLHIEAQKFKEESSIVAERTRTRDEAEIDDLKIAIINLESKIEKSNKDHAQGLQTAREEHSSAVDALESRLKRAEEKVEDEKARAHSALNALDEKERARLLVQVELEDLFMVLGDLEEKRSRDKQLLKSLGELISDVEDGDEADVGVDAGAAVGSDDSS